MVTLGSLAVGARALTNHLFACGFSERRASRCVPSSARVSPELTLDDAEGNRRSFRNLLSLAAVTAAVLGQSPSLREPAHSVCVHRVPNIFLSSVLAVSVMGRGRLQGSVQGKISIDFGRLDLILSVNKYIVIEMDLGSYKLVINFRLLYSLAVSPWASYFTIVSPRFLLCVKKIEQNTQRYWEHAVG